ncbi:MAG: thiamine phosphate synthase [Moraxellaceae bacterium]|nr:thiamine phosphate synthase [Moraxellaceae bacterium]MDZ4387461.1 thiamine phosphate synthase [Moraxellaceae bacterium]
MTSATHHKISGLYAITDHALLGDQLVSAVTAAIEGGARIIQYRDKSQDHTRRLREANALRQLCQQHELPLLINDDVELALAVNADGVHLGQQDGGIAAARARLGATAIIGVTCHNRIDFAEQATAQGASYLAFGAIYPSQSKPQALRCPLAILRQAKQQFNLPLVAIGGISADNIAPVIAAGASACAVIANLWQSVDICQQARILSKEFPPHE